jgi:hypothetical protein
VNYNWYRAKLRLPGFNLWPIEEGPGERESEREREKREEKRLKEGDREDSTLADEAGRQAAGESVQTTLRTRVQDLWVIQETRVAVAGREGVRCMLRSRPAALCVRVGHARGCRGSNTGACTGVGHNNFRESPRRGESSNGDLDRKDEMSLDAHLEAISER